MSEKLDSEIEVKLINAIQSFLDRDVRLLASEIETYKFCIAWLQQKLREFETN